MTNAKFQRDSLVQSLPKVKFPQPVRNPWCASGLGTLEMKDPVVPRLG